MRLHTLLSCFNEQHKTDDSLRGRTMATADLFLQFSTPTLVLAMGALALASYYFYRRLTRPTWEGCGVSSPSLTWTYFLGNDFRAAFSNLLNQYGDSVGFISNTGLSLITTDLNLMRMILLKDFNNFQDRANPLHTRSCFGASLFFAQGQTWRRQRKIVSPTFSTGKLKHTSQTVMESAKSLCKYLEECAESGRLLPLKDACGAYSLEIIAKTAFALDADFIGKPVSLFHTHSKNMLPKRNIVSRVLQQLIAMFPNLLKFSIKILRVSLFDPIDVNADSYFREILKNTFKERRLERKKGIFRGDFLDKLFEVNEKFAMDKLKQTAEENRASSSGSSSEMSKPLTDLEMLGHSVLIIFAGFDTTATTLQWILYMLAQHPDIQEKVYTEITSVVKGDTPTPEELKNLVFTEQVINETLRLFPPLAMIDRRAKEARTYEGVTIPAGASIIFPLYHLMHDPKYWPNPDTFDPSRFSPEEKERRDPMTFSPFGQGPRLCLGMRLAYLELKTALVFLIPKVKVELNERTEPKRGESAVLSKQFIAAPVTPIMLTVMLRN